jgi:hypothetical protein
MKHKAQESLDILCNHAMVYQEDYDYDENPCCEYVSMEKDELDELRNPIQYLINCQLTLEEMKFAANCLYAAGFVDENMVKQILGKFQKQKEMWVSDDETN